MIPSFRLPLTKSFLTAALGLASISQAASVWTGSAGTAWSNAASWTGGLPASGASINIADTTTNNLVLDDGSHTIGTLTFGASGTSTSTFSMTTGANTLTIMGGVVANGAYAALGQSISNSNIVIGANQTWSVGGSIGAVNTDAGLAINAPNAGFSTLVLNGDLTKIGTGQLVLVGTTVSGAGNIVVNAGAFKINAGSSKLITVGGTGGIIVNSGASLFISQNSGTMSVTRNIAINGGGTLVLGGGGATTTSTVASSIAWTGATTLTLQNAGNSYISSGAWTGTGVSITKNGAGTITLTGNNSAMSGAITLAAGNVVLNGLNSIGSSVDVSLTGGALYLAAAYNGGTASIRNLSGSSATSTISTVVTGEAATATVRTLAVNQTTDGTYAGTIVSEAAGARQLALIKNGAAKLTLSGTNTYMGGTTVNAGTLELSGPGGPTGVIKGVLTIGAQGTVLLTSTDAMGYNGGANQVTTININGGTLTHNASGNETWGMVINMTGGTMNRTATATGGWSFGNNLSINTFASTATSTISGGIILREGNTNNSTVFTVNDGAAATDLLVSATIVENAAGFGITKAGAGTMVLSGAGTYTGATIISGGTLQVGDGTTNGSLGATAVTDNARLVFNRADAVTFGNIISGTGTVVQAGTGNLTLSVNNTYTGGLTVNAGTVTLAGAQLGGNTSTSAAGTGALTINSGATVVTSGGAFRLDQNTLATNTRVVNINGGTLTLAAAEYVRTFNMTGGTLNAPTADYLRTAASGLFINALASANTATINNRVDLTFGSLIVDVAPAANLLVTGVISENQGAGSGAKTLTKNNTGTLVLTGANTYTGATTINAGTIQLGNGGTTGSINTTGLAAISLGTAGAGGTLAFNRTDSYSIANALTGVGGVTQLGTGVVTLTGANTYTGLTTVSSGALKIINAGAFGGGAISIASGGTFDLAGASITTKSLTGAGFVTLGAGNLTLAVASGSSEFSGTISGSGNLTKTGAGTEILSGLNLYSGTTTVSAGTLQIGSGGTGGSLASAAVAVAANATLAFNLSGTQTAAFSISGDGSLTQQGPVGSVLVLGGTNTYTGLTHVVSGTLQLGSANAFAGGDITIDNGATFDTGSSTLAINLQTTALNGGGTLKVGGGNLTVVNAAAASFGGTIAGSGNFIKDGAGDLTLTGASTFGGTLTVLNGGLVLGGAGTITGTGTVVVTAPGGLVFAQTQDTVFSAAIAGGGTFTQRADSTGNNRLTGIVSGGIGLTNQGGTGSLTLTNAADIGTVVNAGTTTITSNAAAVTGGTATVGAVTNNAGTLTISSVITGLVNVTGGTLVVGTGPSDMIAQITAASVQVAAGSTLVSQTGTSYSLTGLSGDGLIRQNGAITSTLTLAGANPGLSAAATIRTSSGIIAFADADAIGSATLSLDGGAMQVGVTGGPAVTLANNVVTTDAVLSYLTGLADLNLDGTITGTGIIRYRGPGILTAAGEATFEAGGGQIVRDGGTLDLKGANLGATNYNDNIDITNTGANADFTFQQSQDGVASGTFSGDLNLVKNGVAKLTLTADNTYTGSTTVNGGTLQVGNGGTTGSLGAGPVILNGGLLSYDHSDNLVLTGDYTGAGGIGNAGTGTVSLTGEVNVGGLVASGSGIIISHTATLTDGVAGAPNQTPSTSLLTAYATTLSGTGPLTLESGVIFGAASGEYDGAMGGAGRFIKTGTGTLIIAGNGNVTGGVTVQQGVLQFGNNTAAGTLGGGDIFVASTGTVAFGRSDDFVFSARVTGQGRLSAVGTGKVILTGNNNYAGNTAIGAGATLQIGNNGTTGRIGGGLVQNDGTLIFAHTDNITFANTIVGAGNVMQTTSGTLTLTGSNTYTGTTSVSGGGNIIFNAANLPAGGFDVGANSTLTFTGSGSGTIAGSLVGDATGTIAIAGSGNVVTMTDASGYTGRISVASGSTLRLGTDDLHTADLGANLITVQAGGKLTGAGYVAGSLTNLGTVSPGYSPGVITLAGNFNTTGTLNMEVAGNGAPGAANGYDQIRFAGVANISGTLNITFTNGFVPGVGFSATLLQDTAPVAGVNSITGDFVYVNVNGATGRLIRSDSALVFFNGSSIAQTTGLSLHDGVSPFVNALSPNATIIHPEFANFIAYGSNNGVGALATALQNASPVGLAALTALPINEVNKQADELRRRAELQTLASGTPFGDEADWLAYVGGTGSLLDADSGSSSPTFDTRVFGGYAGLERRVGDGGAAIGVRFSYDNGTADLHDNGGKVEQDHAGAAIYAIAQLGENGYLVGSVGMGYSSYDTKRNTLGGTEKASPSGYDISGSIDAGYVFHLNREWSLTPHVGFSLVSANIGGFTEKGSDLALAVDGYSQTSLTTRLGTGVYREWTSNNFRRDAIRVGLDVSYEHTMFGDTADIPASFATYPQSGGFKSDAPSLIKDSIVVGPQVQWVLSDTRTISLGYRFQYGFDGSTGHRGDISFEQRF